MPFGLTATEGTHCLHFLDTRVKSFPWRLSQYISVKQW